MRLQTLQGTRGEDFVFCQAERDEKYGEMKGEAERCEEDIKDHVSGSVRVSGIGRGRQIEDLTL